MSIEKELREIVDLPESLLYDYDHMSEIQERINISVQEEDFLSIVNCMKGLDQSKVYKYLVQFKQCLLSLESLALKLPSGSTTNGRILDYLLNIPLDPFQDPEDSSSYWSDLVDFARHCQFKEFADRAEMMLRTTDSRHSPTLSNRLVQYFSDVVGKASFLY